MFKIVKNYKIFILRLLTKTMIELEKNKIEIVLQKLASCV